MYLKIFIILSQTLGGITGELIWNGEADLMPQNPDILGDGQLKVDTTLLMGQKECKYWLVQE